MSYLNWNTKVLSDFRNETIDGLYNDGYVATRVDRGIFNQTRSLRIKLDDFETSSENRRILRKNEHMKLDAYTLPYRHYHWTIHKLAKDFYTTKWGADTFSANKAKELMTEPKKSNFNRLFVYKDTKTEKAIGYAICLMTDTILHYSYPFYVRSAENPSIGLGMMINAILLAKEKGLQYIYLGSLQRPSDVYKLQFSGAQWFDGHVWRTDTEPLRDILK